MFPPLFPFPNFASIVHKLMIFFLVKDIDEWNILSLKNKIIVKKKRPKIEESPILADF